MEKMACAVVNSLIDDPFLNAYAAAVIMFSALVLHLLASPFENADANFLRAITLCRSMDDGGSSGKTSPPAMCCSL